MLFKNQFSPFLISRGHETFSLGTWPTLRNNHRKCFFCCCCEIPKNWKHALRLSRKCADIDTKICTNHRLLEHFSYFFFVSNKKKSYQKNTALSLDFISAKNKWKSQIVPLDFTSQTRKNIKNVFRIIDSPLKYGKLRCMRGFSGKRTDLKAFDWTQEIRKTWWAQWQNEKAKRWVRNALQRDIVSFTFIHCDRFLVKKGWLRRNTLSRY